MRTSQPGPPGLSRYADPVSRVTVLGAGQALGLTETLSADDRRLYGEGYWPARAVTPSTPSGWSTGKSPRC